MTVRISCALSILTILTMLPAAAVAQSTASPRGGSDTTSTTAKTASLPVDYLIGVEDLLGIVFWREQDRALSSDVVVRPDGKISVPLLNDLQAAGLTPEQLAAAVQVAATKFIRDPGVTVIVRAIRSRKVFVIGEVAKPGTIPLESDMNVLQVLAQAGGFLEHANKTDVVIVRNQGGREQRFKFNYKDVVKGKKVEQNIRLLPGDTVLVR